MLRPLLLLLVLISVALNARSFDAEARELQRLEFDHGGLNREVWIGRPAGNGPWPLVMALHGGGGVALGMAKLTGLTPLAKREGFLVAYPDSGVKEWNDGRTDFRNPSSDHDDSGWLAALAQDLVQRGLADPKRLYVCGMSNGGFMTVRLACDHPDLFAAAGVVAATKVATYDCPPGSGIPIFYIMGALDPLVPFNGGEIKLSRIGGRSRGKALSFEEALAFWRQRNAAGGETVKSYVVKDGGHAWPGGWAYLGPWLIGKTSQEMNASEALWIFFKDKAR